MENQDMQKESLKPEKLMRDGREQEEEQGQMETGEMGAIELLTQQHREVETLFEEFEQAGDSAYKAKEKIFQQIAEKMEMHARLEEKQFYPALREVDPDMMFEALEEHQNVKSLISRLKKAKGKEESYDAKVKVLKELIQHHVEEEEKEIFPECEAKLDDEMLEEIGQRMMRMMEREENPGSSRSKTRKSASSSKSSASSKRGSKSGKDSQKGRRSVH